MIKWHQLIVETSVNVQDAKKFFLCVTSTTTAAQEDANGVCLIIVEEWGLCVLVRLSCKLWIIADVSIMFVPNIEILNIFM